MAGTKLLHKCLSTSDCKVLYFFLCHEVPSHQLEGWSAALLNDPGSFVLLNLSSNPGCLSRTKVCSWSDSSSFLSLSLSPFLVKCSFPLTTSSSSSPSGTFSLFPLYCCLLHLCQVLQQYKTSCATEMYMKRKTLPFSPFFCKEKRKREIKVKVRRKSWRRVLQVVSFDTVCYYRWDCAKKVNCTVESATHKHTHTLTLSPILWLHQE